MIISDLSYLETASDMFGVVGGGKKSKHGRPSKTVNKVVIKNDIYVDAYKSKVEINIDNDVEID